MTKINFQNLPDTTTPVNATNLNQLQTNVENAMNQTWNNTFALTTAVTANSWTKARSTDPSLSMSTGKYRFIISVSMAGQGNGIATVRPYIDSAEIGSAIRSTIPIVNGLTSSAQVEFVKEITSTPPNYTHYINAQIYSSASCQVTSLVYDIQKLG